MHARWMRYRAVAVLALAVLLGLGAAAEAAKLTRITFYYPVGVAGPLARVIGEMTDKFNREHPDIEVVPVYSGDYNPTMQKVQTAVMAGNPPDVFIVEISELPTLLAMDAITHLDDYVKGAEGGKYWEDFYGPFRENSLVGGKLWGIPFQRSTPVFYWNKEAFKQAGLDPDRPPRTWAELKETARKLTVRDAKGEVQRWGVTVSGGWNDWLFEAFVRQNGGWLISQDSKQLNFASKEAVGALEFWVDLMHKEKVGPPHSTWASTPPDFVAGRTAMLYHSTGILTFLKNSAKFDFGVAFMPAGKGFGAEVGGGNFHIAKRIPKERQDAAWKYVAWMTTPEHAAMWSQASGYVATRKSAYHVPAMKEYVAKNPQYLVARDQLQYASGKMMAPNFQKIREILIRQLDDAVDGKVAPAQAMEIVQKQVEAAIRQ